MNEKEYEDAVIALNSWENGLSDFGNCIIQFQWIERVLAICITEMINCDNEIGEIITAEMSFRAKRTIYRTLFMHLFKSKELPDDIEELIKKISWADEERNKLVHSQWEPSIENPEMIKREKRVCRKKGFLKQKELYSPEDLDDLAKIYKGISTDLIYLTQKYLPDCSFQ